MNEEALLAILSEEGTNEEKAKKIFAAHKADREPLERAKEKILAEKRAEQEKHAKLAGEIEAEREASEARIKELEDRVGKASSEDAKKAFEAQLERERLKFDAERKKLEATLAEKDTAHSALFERRRLDLVGLNLENAMTKLGITDPDDRENCRDKFMSTHGANFCPGDNDEIPINKEHNTVAEVLGKLATTVSAYQKFIPVKNNGGGASGGSNGSPAGKKVISREKSDQMSPQEKADFFSSGGKIG